jgi:signal transduction histidine kinase
MPLRVRLAALNAMVIVVAMCVLGAITYALEQRSLVEGIDESIRTQARNMASLYQVRASLPPRARERVIPQPSVFSAPTFHVQVVDPDGIIMERSAALGNRSLPINPEVLLRAREDDEVFQTVTLDGKNVRVYTLALVADDEFLGYVQVARSLESVGDALSVLSRVLLVCSATLLVVTIGLVWLLAGLSLRPIGRLTQAARDIGLSGRLDKRLPPVGSRDEVARLVETFNHMMDRLESAFTAQRRFVADASHELRTPLTTVRGNIDLLRRSGAVTQPEMQDALADVAEEAERMSRLVNGLLALARADAGYELARKPVRLDEVVYAVQREMQPLAQNVAVRSGEIDGVEVVGDADALKQLLLILVDNGVKYTPPGGEVVLGLRQRGNEAILSVQDTGAGIAEEDLPHIFERFYRSRSVRPTGGTGLGLAIAKWIVGEHGARIQVESSVGAGTRFTVRFPMVSRPAAEASPRGERVPEPVSDGRIASQPVRPSVS